MGKSSKIANLGWIGTGFIIFSVGNFVVYLFSGAGIGSRMGHNVKGGFALLGSAAFFLLGLLLLFVWLILKISGGGQGRNR